MLILNRNPDKNTVIHNGVTMVEVNGNRFRGEPCLDENDVGLKEPSAHCSGLKVLLVENDVGNAEFMTLLLETDGHRVQIAHNGISALRLAQADPPDVVLLEIRLPGMEGWEFVRRLQEQATEKRPFCIAITGCGTQADRRRSQEAGIDIHMLKPVDSRFLRKVLKRFQAVIRLGDLIQEAS